VNDQQIVSRVARSVLGELPATVTCTPASSIYGVVTVVASCGWRRGVASVSPWLTAHDGSVALADAVSDACEDLGHAMIEGTIGERLGLERAAALGLLRSPL